MITDQARTLTARPKFSTRMRKRKAMLIAMVLAVAPVIVAEAATVDVSANDTTATELKEVQVSARRDNNGKRSAAPSHSLDAAKILTTGVTDISDALKRLPGVNLRDYGGSGGMKTVSVRGLGTQHTGVLYDGVALGDARGGQIDLSRYSLDNLSSLTLNIGDADDIYIPARSLASAATLSVNTLRNPDLMSRHPEISVRLRAASFMTLNPYVRIGLSNGENLGMSLAGEYTHAKNNYPITIRNGSTTTHERRNNSQLNLGHVEWNGIWKPTVASTLQAKAYWFDNSRHLPGPVTYYNNVSHERLREKNTFGQIVYNVRLSGKLSLKAIAKYNWSYSRYEDEDGRYHGGFIDQRYYQQEEYGAATLLYRPVSGLSLAYAADFWHNSLRSNLTTDSRPIRNSLLQSLSAKWQVWRLTLTARGLLSIIHDRSETTPSGKTETKLSPSVGVSLQPIASEDWHLRASYKNVFRMPTFNELYFYHYGTVNLDPETADQLNLGTTWGHRVTDWLPRIDITVDGYLNLVRNKIVAMPYNMFVWTMTNLGRVRILGLDITLNADFRVTEGHNLMVSGNYSYQRAAPRTDRAMLDWMKQVAYTPLNSGAWSLTWKNPWVNAVAHGTGCSARYPTSNNVAGTRISGYMEIGFTLYREFAFRGCSLELRADLVNALDRRYEIIARYPMPGRSWAGSVTFKF